VDTAKLEEANIGECLLDKDTSVPMQEDIKKTGSIGVSLSDRTTSLREQSQDVDMSGFSILACSFVQRTKTESSVGRLMKASVPCP
jgi:hypothetical protein